MANPSDLHKFPLPQPDVAGQNNVVPAGFDLGIISKLYRPKGAPLDEAEAATVARFAQYLVDSRGNAMGVSDIASAANIAAGLGYTPQNGSIGYQDRFAERAEASVVTAGTTPLVGANYRLNMTGGTTPPYISGGALRGASGTLFYLGNVTDQPIVAATFVVEHKASLTPSAVNSGNFTIGISNSPLLPSTSATTGNLDLYENMLHFTFEWNRITSFGIRNSSAAFEAMVTTDGLSSNIPHGNSSASGYMALNTKYAVHIEIKAGEARVTSMGRTYVIKDARIQGDYDSWYYEATGDALGGTQYNTVCYLHSAWINAPQLDQTPGLGAQPNNGLLTEWSSSAPVVKQKPTFLGNNDALVGDVPSGWTPTMNVGGATLTGNTLTQGGLNSEGRISRSMPRKNVGIGYGLAVMPGTYQTITAKLESSAGGAETAAWGKYFAIDLVVGDSERFEWGGTFGANANTKRIRVRIDGGTFPAGFDSGNLTENGTSWKLILTRQVLTGDAFRLSWEFWHGATRDAMAFTTVASAASVAVAHYLMFTGTAAGDVTAYTLNGMLRECPW